MAVAEFNREARELDQLYQSGFATEEASIIKAALNLIEEKCLGRKESLYYFEEFQQYLVLRFAGLTNEQGHVLYLNSNHELLAAETEFYGWQCSVQWDIRKVVFRAITLGAVHVVFAHNHPNNNPTPSDADLEHLYWSIKVLQPLNINLLDSYVVTARGITSIKAHQMKLVEASSAKRRAEDDLRRAERRAKIAATKARKAAERAAQSAVGADLAITHRTEVHHG